MLNRRQFVASSVALGLGSALGLVSGAEESKTGRPKPIVLHQTDLFHPHMDPDDHFDLATIFALAALDAVDLRGLILDYPPDFHRASPAVGAVAQMSRTTGVAAPIVVGGNARFSKRGDACSDLPKSESLAIDFIVDQLERAESPVRVIIAGSATDVAVASSRRPELFREKCAGVYLNAGAAFPKPDEPDKLEYNVELNPAAYATMFDLPCPLCWFPCWHNVLDWKSGENSSFYFLEHADAFRGVSDALCGFFAYMFSETNDVDWLKRLEKPSDDVWNGVLAGRRAMWCTASLLLLADKSVSKDGEIVERTDKFEQSADALFKMEYIDVSCDDAGRTTWKYADRETNRKIVRVLDVDAYPKAMAKAINTLFRSI